MSTRPDPAAEATEFADFYREHFGEAVRLAFLLTSSVDAAQDLAQDAFVGLHRRWAAVDDPGPYVRRAVVNACHSYHRRRFLERRRNGAAPVGPEGLDADELSDALAQLPYRQRAALVLRFYRDLPDAEIGAVLGCRTATVRSLVFRGLEQLRRVIER